MTLHQFAPILPVAIASLTAVALSGWNLWRIKFAYRASGRREVERVLASRGETPIAISELPVTSLSSTAGLSAAVIFEVHAHKADGRDQVYQWAYRPRVFPWQTEGLQRLAHRIWIPV